MRPMMSLALVAAALIASSPARAENPSAGKAVEVHGTAWMQAPGTSRKPLAVGAAIPEGAKIGTDVASEAKVLLISGDKKDAALYLKPGTEIDLGRIREKDWQLALKSGAVLTEVANPEKRPHHFSIRTRAATMGVRGTVFFVKDEGAQGDFLCTCHGTVEVESLDGRSHISITSQHHDYPKQIRSGSAALEGRMTPADMGHDHSDADGQALHRFLE